MKPKGPRTMPCPACHGYGFTERLARVEGERDRAEVLESYADQVGGTLQPDTTIQIDEVTEKGRWYRYRLALVSVEEIE